MKYGNDNGIGTVLEIVTFMEYGSPYRNVDEVRSRYDLPLLCYKNQDSNGS